MPTLHPRAPRTFPIISAAITALFATALAIPPPSAPQFAQEHSDLRADPSAKFGTLKNGMRFVILPNHEPKDRVSLRLLVVAGALQENEDQRGLAHFLEHLAFNGSTHYAPGTLVEFFQRMGMSFGGDTNAFTSNDRTQYMIDLPDTKPETLAEGLTVLADYAGGLLLEQTSIDKERGIILSEKRVRDSVQWRAYIAESEFLLGSTRIPARMPIGITPVIEQANRDRFVDYYDTWYRPERIAVIAVGDFDPGAIEKLINEKLSGIPARAPARPDPDLGTLASFDGLRALHHHEAESPSTTVGIQTIAPIPDPDKTDNAASRLASLPRNIANSILTRRLAILSQKETSAFISGYAYTYGDLNFYRNTGIDLICKPAQWHAALATAEQELRRALQHGFTDAELREAVATTLNRLEQAAKTAPTRRSDQLANEIATALVNGNVFTAPADNLALLKPALKTLTPEACLAALRDAWAVPSRYLTVIGNAKVTGASSSQDAQNAIIATYTQSSAIPVAPPEKTDDTLFAYTDFGPAGAIAQRTHIDDLDIDLITLANGVRLNLKKTDFEAGKIQISLRIGAGDLTQPSDKPGLDLLADNAFLAGGLGKHSADELQRILAGRTISTQFSAKDDAFTFRSSTNRDDLLLQLQLLAAGITDPGYRPEAMRRARTHLEQLYTSLAHIPQGPLNIEVIRYLAGGDARFGYPKQTELTARTLDEVRDWLAPQFATGPIEIAIVGDIDTDAAIDAVARTLGALPARDTKPPLEAGRRITFGSPVAKTHTYDSEIPKGLLAVFWPTTDGLDAPTACRLDLLTSVLSDRLRVQIREKLGDSYSPFATNFNSITYPGFGYTLAYVTIDPAKAQLLDETIAAIAGDLVKNGVTEDELTRAKLPALTRLRESERTNAYWLDAMLASAQELPQRLDWSRTRRAATESITTAELTALAKKYLPCSRAIRATIIPSTPAPSPQANQQ